MLSGDPIGLLLFVLAVDQIVSGVESEMKNWYFDNLTIGGSPESVLNDVQTYINELKRIGFEGTLKKTKIINIGFAAGNVSRVVYSFNILLT